jgi:hypothetical protein
MRTKVGRMPRALAALLFVLSASAASAAPELVACAYSPGEIAASFGKVFRNGKGTQTAIPGGTQSTCTYQQDRSSLVLTVVQTVLSEAEHRRRKADFMKSLTGTLTAMAADPDGATWQLDPYAPNFMALHYLHGTKRVELRVTGTYFRVAEMQPKMLRLRRLR